MRKNILLIVGAVIILVIFVTVFQGRIFKKEMSPNEQEISDTNTSATSTIQSTYTHPSPKFSFEYPDGFSVGSFPEGQDSETILVHNANGENSMQILISAFDENIMLTKKRILKDAPDTEVRNEKEITIGKNAKGLAFEGTNSSGATSEVWFAYNNHLYQISAPKNSSEFLGSIIKTWVWNK